MTLSDFETMKRLERFSRVNNPLMQLLNERWAGRDGTDEKYRDALRRIQVINQELLDLITEGIL